MTYKEKLAEINPSQISEEFTGGVFGCPSDHFYMPHECAFAGEGIGACKKCWNRPYRGERIKPEMEGF